MKHTVIRRAVIRRDKHDMYGRHGWHVDRYFLGLHIDRRPYASWNDALTYTLLWTHQ